jgi:hypothetical protein
MLRLTSIIKTRSCPGGGAPAGRFPQRGWAKATIKQAMAIAIPGVPSRDGRPRCARASQVFRRRHRPRIVQIDSGKKNVKSQSNSG